MRENKSSRKKIFMTSRKLVPLRYIKVLLFQGFFFSLSFLSQTFAIHRTAGKGGGYLFRDLPLPHTSQALFTDISRAIPARISLILHLASSQTRTESLWFPSASR